MPLTDKRAHATLHIAKNVYNYFYKQISNVQNCREVINHRKLSRKTQWACYKSTREMLRLAWGMVRISESLPRSVLDACLCLGVVFCTWRLFLKGQHGEKRRVVQQWDEWHPVKLQVTHLMTLISSTKTYCCCGSFGRRHLEYLNEEQT